MEETGYLEGCGLHSTQLSRHGRPRPLVEAGGCSEDSASPGIGMKGVAPLESVSDMRHCPAGHVAPTGQVVRDRREPSLECSVSLQLALPNIVCLD